MTTPTSSSPQGTRDDFDTGPLSWVMGEIREALTRSKSSLLESVGQDAETQSTALRHAKTYLHQAHGALQIVDVDGVALITETVEDMFDRIEAGQLAMTEGMAQAIDNAYQALLEYLEELLSGSSHQPVRLFPYYRALLETRGAERIHPADLFFPNLAIRPQLPAQQATAEAIDYVTLRKQFERALLPFLRSTDSAAEMASASAMRDIVGQVQRAQANQQSRAFWWVMQGFADAVASGQVRNEIYIKQLFARINLQIRRLSEGSSSIAERLLRDALFFIARAENASPQVQEIRHAYGLDGLVPVDYEKKRYGQVDVDALGVAKERLSHAKNVWNRIAGGDASVAASFEQEMLGLAEACAKLDSPPLSKLLSELNGITRHAVHANSSVELGMEMATSLLFVENALNRIARLPDDFSERSDAMTARLLSIVSGEQPQESAPWLDDISRQVQQRQTMLALAAEMQTSLRQVEKMLDEYFREPSQREALAQIDTTLHQIEGALAILDQEDAARAVRHTQAAVRRFAESEEIPDQQEFQHVAQNVGALSFFIETLQLQSDGAKKRFSFDDKLGLFRANLIEKTAPPPQAALDVDLDSVDMLAPIEKKSDAGVPGSESEALPTVEAELALHQKKSAELAESLSAEPDNPALQEQLKESLEQVRLDATLLDNPEANDRARAAIKMLANPDFAASQDTLANIVSATAQPQAPAPQAVVAPVTPDTDEEVDAELLEIFLSEAEEVLGCVCETVPQSRNEPYNQDHLTTLRRSFHTLKGSGRMVGLNAFGEAAWGIEQVLNLRLSETRAGDADLYALLEKAAEELGAWVQDLQTKGRSDRTAAALVRAAEGVKLGNAFTFDETVAAESAPAAPDETPAMDAMPAPSESVETMAIETMTEAAAAPVDIELEAAPESEAFAEDPAMPLTFAAAEEIEMSDDDLAALRSDLHVSEPEAEPDMTALPVEDAPVEVMPIATPVAEVFDFPGMVVTTVEQDDNVKHIGDLQISVPLHNIYLAETDELVRLLSQDISEWRHEADRQVNILAVHAAHSLAGSSATVGFTPLQEVAHALEAVLQHLARKPAKLLEDDYDTLEHAIERIRFMLQMFALGEMPDHEPQQVEILEGMLQSIYARSDPRFGATLISPVAPPAIETAELGLDAVEEPDQAPEPTLEFAAEPVSELTPDSIPEPEPEPVELEPAIEFEPVSEPVLELPSEAVPELAPEMELASEPELIPEPMQEPVSEAEPQLTSEPVLESIPEPELEPELVSEPEVQPEPELVSEPLQELAMPEMASEPAPEPEPEPAPEPVAETEPVAVDTPQEVAEPVARVQEPTFEKPVFSVRNDAATDHVVVIKDELDADLMPVFLEEGSDILPQIAQVLRSWQQRPQDTHLPQSMLRFLHTIKGSARMAGAMTFGQEMHEMETRIEHITHAGVPSTMSIEQLLARYDHALQMFEQLLNPGASKPVAPMEPAAETSEAQTSASGEPAAPRELVVLNSLIPSQASNVSPIAAPVALAPDKAAVTASSATLVRVRADILDRLVNQAGEVSISRSKLEIEVGTLRQSLSELNENVGRLRDQLREIEMQAESQITSRMAHSADREFDPLEFDRFTRLQELTRMMAESVNDVGSVQLNLTRTVDGASNDLTTQARLTRDLQQDLMRVRMVQFASISERLYRVTRQASKEVNKRVNLDIRGSGVEVDRGVLDKMVGPFEHLLRNAIVHGIETREARQAAGKSEVGELLVEIRQEGNEVVIRFADDGQGLNLENIRKKARKTGLLKDDTEMSDAEVTDLIFDSGFSTAEEVTELAGRGVGMDVVRSEATALGGRVLVVSEPGKGANFTIHLPLTLAVTQVVLMSTGGRVYAVPSVLVEQVQQLKTNMLTAVYNDGAVMWQGQRVPMYYLSTLLGDVNATPIAQQYSPILILRSGNDRVAIHVDEVQGNREVVVKNIGPQLARMIGIAGATVMGSGDIVLILNPVPLAQRFVHESMRAPQAASSDAPQQMGAVAEMVTSEPAAPKAEPVQGLRTQHIVMVVDDSLTVRRVTQRLLAREGYQVVLAKDGVDALEHLQSITPDVMLVDIEMPRMDGFDLTRNVRGDERTRHIPIIMITSRTATKHRNYAMELGVNEYLGKPYQEDILLKMVAGFVANETPVA